MTKFFKTVLVIAIIEFLLFVVMVFFSMTNEGITPFGQIINKSFSYIAGFPLVLLNSEFPFFLERSKIPIYIIPLICLNSIIQAFIVIFFRRLLKIK